MIQHNAFVVSGHPCPKTPQKIQVSGHHVPIHPVLHLTNLSDRADRTAGCLASDVRLPKQNSIRHGCIIFPVMTHHTKHPHIHQQSENAILVREPGKEVQRGGRPINPNLQNTLRQPKYTIR